MEVANLVLAVAMGLGIAIASINWANSIRQGRVRVEDWSRFEDSGYSLREEDVFLKRLKHRKYVVLGLLLANLVFEISGAQPTLAAVISIYMLLLVLFSAHETYVYQLSALTLVGSLISGRTLLLPTYTHRNWTHGLVFAMNALLCLISLTTPLSPPMTYGRTRRVAENATGSILNSALFLFTTEIFSLRHLPSFEIHDLPILPANIRTAWNLSAPHSGAHPIISQLLRVNLSSVTRVGLLSFGLAFTYYAPSFFLNKFLQYLEDDTSRSERGAAWIWVCGLGVAHFALALAMSQQQFVGHVLKIKLRLQLNTLLFSKTLLRQNVSAESSEDAVNSKADIIALMSSDVEQVVGLADAIYDIVDTPVEILVGIFFLYRLLGVSSLVGLVVVLICLPLHHVSGSVVAQTQRNLVHARDERIALTNEILGAIRMLKFMAWETRFEEKVLRIRMKELAYQKLTYTIEQWDFDSVPILFAITSFWHFTVIRGQDLTPAIAFTALSIFTEIQFAIKGIPAAVINIIKASVSLNRIQRYLDSPEVTPVVSGISASIELKAATIAWPKAALSSDYEQFTLKNVTVSFPPGRLSLVCGKFGSGKSLLLLGLLGEANIVEGTVTCPRSHPNSLESLSGRIDPEGWVVPGVTAYVPQTAWLRNQSIKDNILFHLPLDKARYRATLHACALVADLQVLEDGDESEIGEHGVNLSGGQKARVSLARAVYSCASTLLLDDVLSAVDSHTAHHIYHHCLTGPLMQDWTVILVSHHVQLCAPGAALVVALQDGKVVFQGDADGFSRKMRIFDISELGRDNAEPDRASITTATTVVDDTDPSRRKPARKYVEEESRSRGVIDSDIWVTYMRAAGSYRYWMGLAVILFMGGASSLLENGWLKTWSASDATESRGAMFYVGVYAGLTLAGLAVKTFRWFMLYSGSIQASRTIFQDLLHSILNTTIHFHDTISRGRVLNRFGKDLEAIDKQVAVTVGHSVMALVSAMITFCVMTLIGGWVFFAVSLFLGAVYFHYGKMYASTSREMRRLSSISSSPLHSVYWETVSGITTLRAFGASSQFMTNLIKILDNNTAPLYWTAAMGQWLGLRSNALTGVLTFAVAIMAVFSPRIDAGLTGFMILFATQVTNDFQNMAMRYSGLEQDLVSLERIKEYSELTPEVSSDCELIPPPKWPQQGSIRCENLVVRYTPESPPVLHGLNFDIKPGEKIGIVGRTGSGKSTLALSLFRFIPHFEGTIFVDGLDISKIGLAELRRSLTIIPQDPTILSGTLRSTLDVFGEHTDSEIFDALRRVHLLSNQDSEPEMGGEQINVFRNLDSPVSEGGDNLSLGEKQLICMARAILKHSQILIMDEATASIDYATDELINSTIHEAFKASTVLTIAHRLSTILTYDRIMVLDSGRIVEFDSPAALLADSTTRFHAMYKVTGGRKQGV